MKNLYSIIIAIFCTAQLLSSQDTSYVTYQSSSYPSEEDSYNEIHLVSDSTIITVGHFNGNTGKHAAITLQDYHFNISESNYYDFGTNFRDWDEPSFRSFQDSNSVYLFMINDADSSLNVHQYDYELQLVSEQKIDLALYPYAILKDVSIKDSVIYIAGYFENVSIEREAIFLKISMNDGKIIYDLRGSDLFSFPYSSFYSFIQKDSKTYLYFNGQLPDIDSNSGVLRISGNDEPQIIKDWYFPAPFNFSFHFLDSTEYIYNARNDNLTFPNWWAQYYENLENGEKWEAIDNSAWDFTSVTITGFTKKTNENILAFGYKENFFNTDNVEFPNLFNVQNFSTAYITELDRNSGERLWEYMYLTYDKDGEIEQSIIYDVAELPDGSIVAAGKSVRDNVGDDLPDKYVAAMLIKLPGDGCFDEDCDDLFSFTSATSDDLAPLSNNNILHIFPNPSHNLIYLQGFDQLENRKLNYQIFTADGLKVKENKNVINKDGQIDISYLKPNTYFITFIDQENKSTYVVKVIKI